MRIRHFEIIFSLFVGLFLISSNGAAQDGDDRHIKVALRMIGHEVLLAADDSLSLVLVLPIKEEKGRYSIGFESDFEFYPDDLNTIVVDVAKRTKMAAHYIVEVENCNTKEIVYSFEKGADVEMLPCRGRAQPSACYNILITIIDDDKAIAIMDTDAAGGSLGSSDESKGSNYWGITLFVIVALVVFG